MNGSELADAIATRLGVSRASSHAFLDALTDEIARALERGDKVTLRGFGAFQPVERAERSVRLPTGGEPIVMPPATIVAFRPGAGLRQRMASARKSDGDFDPAEI